MGIGSVMNGATWIPVKIIESDNGCDVGRHDGEPSDLLPSNFFEEKPRHLTVPYFRNNGWSFRLNDYVYGYHS